MNYAQLIYISAPDKKGGGGGGGGRRLMRIMQRQCFLFLNESVCCDPMVLMWGHNLCLYGEIQKIIPKLSLLPLLNWSTVPCLG